MTGLLGGPVYRPRTEAGRAWPDSCVGTKVIIDKVCQQTVIKDSKDS